MVASNVKRRNMSPKKGREVEIELGHVKCSTPLMHRELDFDEISHWVCLADVGQAMQKVPKADRSPILTDLRRMRTMEHALALAWRDKVAEAPHSVLLPEE